MTLMEKFNRLTPRDREMLARMVIALAMQKEMLLDKIPSLPVGVSMESLHEFMDLLLSQTPQPTEPVAA